MLLGIARRYLSTRTPRLVTMPHAFAQTTASGSTTGSKTPELDSESALSETVRDFLPPSDFHSLLKIRGLDFFAGVPDSLLKNFCAYVQDNTEADKHVICSNEGAAVSLAAGYHLATRKIPIVYMQNSGFGNSVNPLVSLADPAVYSIPMLLLIGWRGEPGKRDECQHLVQGRITPSLLADLNIPFQVLPDFLEGAVNAIDTAMHSMSSRQAPYALLVRRQCFAPYKLKHTEGDLPNALSREQAIEKVLSIASSWDVFVATTGFASRELFEIRAREKAMHDRDFLTVGSMGHSSAIALGIAMGKPSRQVWCLDGDGAAIMHLGSMCTVGLRKCPNYKHVLFNNGAHDSVGGQPTGAFGIDFAKIALAVGYTSAATATTEDEVAAALKELREAKGPAFLEIRIRKGARKNLGRPTTSPVENKEAFMGFLSN
ncbi:unnamed protein product (mitochondrion) [Plasmodiophora brassicae]|uniref:Phosphonopyruvate decarboxylase n=2 Tax=Plasmodiophora brassicae TaxID=37360 RepID=A0A3P3Y9I6_PLABS|nr:unnamed protein product [Plasmodiophora brassicae]